VEGPEGTQLLRARRGPRLDLDRGDRVRLEVDGPVITFGEQRELATAS
jgi:hypothetical protein